MSSKELYIVIRRIVGQLRRGSLESKCILGKAYFIEQPDFVSELPVCFIESMLMMICLIKKDRQYIAEIEQPTIGGATQLVELQYVRTKGQWVGN